MYVRMYVRTYIHRNTILYTLHDIKYWGNPTDKRRNIMNCFFLEGFSRIIMSLSLNVFYAVSFISSICIRCFGITSKSSKCIALQCHCFLRKTLHFAPVTVPHWHFCNELPFCSHCDVLGRPSHSVSVDWTHHWPTSMLNYTNVPLRCCTLSHWPVDKVTRALTMTHASSALSQWLRWLWRRVDISSVTTASRHVSRPTDSVPLVDAVWDRISSLKSRSVSRLLHVV